MSKIKICLLIQLFVSVLVFPTSNVLAQSPNQVYLPLVSSSSSTNSQTANYFVSTSGNDNNPGTRSQPWRTIQKAANTLVAGKSVFIMPGTYKEKFSPKNSGSSGAYITYTADPGKVILDGSGLSMSTDSRGDGLVQILGKSYIKVQNLTLKNSSVNCVNISDSSSGARSNYIEISGLTIQNCTKVGIRARASDNILINDNKINHIQYSSGIGIWRSTNVIVDFNTITNAHYYHECQGAHDEALTISNSRNFEVSNNILDNTETPPSGFCDWSDKLGIDVKESSQNGLVHHNTVRNMSAGGIYVDGWKAGSGGTESLNNIDIYNNQVSDGGGIVVGCEQPEGVVEYINIYNNLVVNASFSGIQVRGAWGDGLRKNISIYHNTIYGALPSGGSGGAGIYVTTANLGSNNGDAPVIIRNNISSFYFLSNEKGSYVGQIRAGNSTIASKIYASHNLVYGPQVCSSEYPDCVEVGSRISAPPDKVFLNPGSKDLRLKPGSPAIDKGTNVGIVSEDIVGTPRPIGNAFDIGTYEFN